MVDSEAATRTARTLDVSGGGVALECSDLAVGSVVDLYFELPIGFAVEAKARVVRSVGGVVGLAFFDLAKETQVALRSFCRISGLGFSAVGAAGVR